MSTTIQLVGEVMPAAVIRGPGRLEVEDIAVPAIGPTDVLVEVEQCGVCGSDLHLVLDGWAPAGTVPGHEWTGTVAAVGDQVDRWSPGDAVVGGGAVRCGSCRHCLAGRPSLCDARAPAGAAGAPGAFARFTAAPAATLLARPPEVSARAAALTEPLAVALHALDVARVEPGQRVLVLGAGPIGALCIAALRALGVDDVVAVEPGESRRALAAAVGATEVRVPDELDVPTVVEPGREVDGAVDVVLECSGARRAMEAGLAQLRRRGTLVLVGAGMEAPRFDPNRILINELVVTGSYEHGAGGFDRALELLASGSLPVDRLLEPGEVPLTGVLGAMEELRDGRRAGKVLVRP